tara:strand:+ start:310 stop:771 length:462 start_codon:yes stop_codon:yes gene_type:complete
MAVYKKHFKGEPNFAEHVSRVHQAKELDKFHARKQDYKYAEQVYNRLIGGMEAIFADLGCSEEIDSYQRFAFSIHNSGSTLVSMSLGEDIPSEHKPHGLRELYIELNAQVIRELCGDVRLHCLTYLIHRNLVYAGRDLDLEVPTQRELEQLHF